MKRNLLLIDGHHFLWKSYGVPFKFHSKKGTPLHVATVFLALVKRAIAVVDQSGGGVTEIAVVFDSNAQTSNHLLSKDYKANRKTDYSQDEDSPFHHLPYVLKALKRLKIKIYEKRGVEADDLIASLAAQYLKKHKNGTVFIASSDSDFYQLLSKNVRQILFGKKGANLVIGPKEIKERLGITPKQYVYFKSLTGDKADNIIGVPNVGHVRAARIINKKLAFDKKTHAAVLELNRKLIELNRTLEVCKNWTHIAVPPKVRVFKSQELFEKLGL